MRTTSIGRRRERATVYAVRTARIARFASIAIARERLSIPFFVLVRPRPGDFHYDGLEPELMLRDIAQCRALGCDGVVIGALDAQGGIDVPLCRELVQAAGPLQVTFELLSVVMSATSSHRSGGIRLSASSGT